MEAMPVLFTIITMGQATNGYKDMIMNNGQCTTDKKMDLNKRLVQSLWLSVSKAFFAPVNGSCFPREVNGNYFPREVNGSCFNAVYGEVMVGEIPTGMINRKGKVNESCFPREVNGSYFPREVNGSCFPRKVNESLFNQVPVGEGESPNQQRISPNLVYQVPVGKGESPNQQKNQSKLVLLAERINRRTSPSLFLLAFLAPSPYGREMMLGKFLSLFLLWFPATLMATQMINLLTVEDYPKASNVDNEVEIDVDNEVGFPEMNVKMLEHLQSNEFRVLLRPKCVVFCHWPVTRALGEVYIPTATNGSYNKEGNDQAVLENQAAYPAPPEPHGAPRHCVGGHGHDHRAEGVFGPRHHAVGHAHAEGDVGPRHHAVGHVHAEGDVGPRHHAHVQAREDGSVECGIDDMNNTIYNPII